MLKLMPEENNSNISQNNANVQVEANSSQLPANPQQTPNQPPANPQPQITSQHSSRKLPKTLVLLLIVVLIIAGSATAGYFYGKSKNKSETSKSAVVAPKPIDLPPEAIVTSECTPGRGKQYIIPKDIPKGPIYDVKNSKVIAIEYTLGVKSLLTDSDNFSDTILLLTKTYPVDHFSIVTVTPKAGDTDQYIHLIMFVVSKEEAKSITCKDSTTSSQPSTTNSSTSNSQTTDTPSSSQTTTQ